MDEEWEREQERQRQEYEREQREAEERRREQWERDQQREREETERREQREREDAWRKSQEEALKEFERQQQEDKRKQNEASNFVNSMDGSISIGGMLLADGEGPSIVDVLITSAVIKGMHKKEEEPSGNYSATTPQQRNHNLEGASCMGSSVTSVPYKNAEYHHATVKSDNTGKSLPRNFNRSFKYSLLAYDHADNPLKRLGVDFASYAAPLALMIVAPQSAPVVAGLWGSFMTGQAVVQKRIAKALALGSLALVGGTYMLAPNLVEQLNISQTTQQNFLLAASALCVGGGLVWAKKHLNVLKINEVGFFSRTAKAVGLAACLLSAGTYLFPSMGVMGIAPALPLYGAAMLLPLGFGGEVFNRMRQKKKALLSSVGVGLLAGSLALATTLSAGITGHTIIVNNIKPEKAERPLDHLGYMGCGILGVGEGVIKRYSGMPDEQALKLIETKRDACWKKLKS